MRIGNEYYLDYSISNVLNNYQSNDGYKYDHVRWEIWLKNPDLCNEINNVFHTKFKIEENIEITEELVYNIWHFVKNRKELMGTFGSKYLNSII